MWQGDGVDPSEAPERGTTVQSLARGLSVITAFDAEHPVMSVSDIARRTGLARAVVARFVRTLEDLGYLRGDGRRFALTPRVLELGFSYLSALSLPEIAQPHLEMLSASVHESASASVLDGADIVYVARVPTQRIMSLRISIGTRFPAVTTSMGRVLLAALPVDRVDAVLGDTEVAPRTPRTIVDGRLLRVELERVREQGYALVDEELEVGLRSIAVPVRRGPNGLIVAAINVSTASARYLPDAMIAELLPPLLGAAERIGADLAGARGL